MKTSHPWGLWGFWGLVLTCYGSLRVAHDLRGELETLSVPTLLIWGNRDGVIGYGDLFRFGRKIPGARTILLDDTGHVAMVEHPEWFDRTASEFLLGELVRDRAE